MEEYINIVDEQGNRMGPIEKIRAHQKGLLHEAFSLFIFNEHRELLLQRRAIEKYHSGGLWTNTCCSHPRFEESPERAVHRRLEEEIGFDCMLQKIGHIVYKAPFENGLTEYEFDSLYIGTYPSTNPIHPDPIEVCEYKWMPLSETRKDIKKNPDRYTAWFKIIMQKDLLDMHL